MGKLARMFGGEEVAPNGNKGNEDLAKQTLEAKLNFGQSLLNTAKDLTTTISQAAVAYHQIDACIAKMDNDFKRYVAGLEFELQKHNNNSVTIRQQLDSVNKQIDRCLDAAIGMDDKGDAKLIDLKMKLLDNANTYSQQITTMLIKLL